MQSYFGQKPEEKRPTHRRYLKEIGFEDTAWINLAQGRIQWWVF
jgi:hypothetical protein